MYVGAASCKMCWKSRIIFYGNRRARHLPLRSEILKARTRRIILHFSLAFVIAFSITNLLVCRQSFRGNGTIEVVNQKRTVTVSGDLGGQVMASKNSSALTEQLSLFVLYQHANQCEQHPLVDALFHQVRILCWILTSQKTLRTRATHIRATWARKCNKVLYISSHHDPDFPTVKINAPEGHKLLWAKTRGAFQYIYEHHLNDADWFLKADDDTYVIMENLRYMLIDKNPREPVYFGRRFKGYTQQGYMSGGAGYVLSKLALVLAVEKAFPVVGSGLAYLEDIQMGRCMDSVGVVAGDSRDYSGKETFHPFPPWYHTSPDLVPAKFWFWEFIYYPVQPVKWSLILKL